MRRNYHCASCHGSGYETRKALVTTSLDPDTDRVVTTKRILEPLEEIEVEQAIDPRTQQIVSVADHCGCAKGRRLREQTRLDRVRSDF